LELANPVACSERGADYGVSLIEAFPRNPRSSEPFVIRSQTGRLSWAGFPFVANQPEHGSSAKFYGSSAATPRPPAARALTPRSSSKYWRHLAVARKRAACGTNRHNVLAVLTPSVWAFFAC